MKSLSNRKTKSCDPSFNQQVTVNINIRVLTSGEGALMANWCRLPIGQRGRHGFVREERLSGVHSQGPA